ncbi:MAG: hypothetical protein ACT4PT_03305 [Methanobacteriota archaeon]
MPSLRISCKSCASTFDSGIAIGWNPRPVLGLHLHNCPHCGAEHAYRSDDSWVIAAAPAPPAPSFASLP